jgi:L-threonylcarbamoyladenylate synthase
MEIMELTPRSHDSCVQRMVEGARRGELMLFPTDTVYGLGGMAFSHQVMEKLRRVKPERPLKPTAVLIDNIIRMSQCAGDVPNRHIVSLAEEFWPGALTIIWKMSKAIPPESQTADLSLGYRVPNHEFLLEVLSQIEIPLWATSANLPGQPPPRIASEIRSAVIEACDLFIRSQELPKGRASAVVDVRGKEPVVLRESTIREDDIRLAWRGR